MQYTRMLKAGVQNIELEKVKPVEKLPVLENLKDLVSGTENDKLSPGGIVQVEGEELKFDATDPAQGVFFIAATDGSEIKAAVIARNMPSELTFMAPQLSAGSYKVEVRSVGHKGKKMRTGRLDTPLTVA